MVPSQANISGVTLGAYAPPSLVCTDMRPGATVKIVTAPTFSLHGGAVVPTWGKLAFTHSCAHRLRMMGCRAFQFPNDRRKDKMNK